MHTTEDATVTLATREARAWQRDYDRVASAIAWLDEHRVEQPQLGEVAVALHLSPGHLQRTFTRFAGTSPTRFLRWLTAGAARDLLRERATVLDTTHAVGLSSAGRLHELLVTMDGVTPGELGTGGSGLEIRVGVHPTPLGPVLVALTPRGVLALTFLDTDEDPAAAVGGLTAQWPRARVTVDAAATAEVAARFRAVLAGGSAEPLVAAVPGTNLQLRVWEALLQVPDDRVVTYAEVARAVGAPQAVRAVANAVGRNRIAALVPCHRVLRSTGGLGGYRWGTVRKRVLLAREAARADAVASG